VLLPEPCVAEIGQIASCSGCPFQWTSPKAFNPSWKAQAVKKISAFEHPCLMSHPSHCMPGLSNATRLQIDDDDDVVTGHQVYLQSKPPAHWLRGPVELNHGHNQRKSCCGEGSVKTKKNLLRVHYSRENQNHRDQQT
jgi:hypothetical protein